MKPILLTAALALCPIVLHAALTDGLVAYYTFDETTGTTAADTIRGEAGNGTLTNFAGTQWIAGRIGGAVTCDGVNDWISAPNAIASGATAMSFSGWVWATSRRSWGSIAKNWGGTAVGQFHFGLNAGDGRLSNYLTNGTSVIDPAVFPTGSWQHVAFTYDGATHRVYRNGVQVGSLDTATTLIPNSPTVAFGAKPSNDGTVSDPSVPGFWNGRFDDFGFWDRALSAAEVLEIYNAGLTGVGIGATVPSAYDAWAAAKGLTGPAGSATDPAKTADPDKDGKNNLQEFALDGNPLLGADDGKVVAKVATVGIEQAMTLTLPVRGAAAVPAFSDSSGDELSALIDGIYYRIEGDLNLGTFADDVTQVTPALDAGLPTLSAGWSYRTFRAPGMLSTAPRAFMRAVISETP